MADERENLVLHHLIELRDEVRDMLAHFSEEFHFVKARLGTLERQYATISDRLDHMDLRIERIERRLDLADAK